MAGFGPKCGLYGKSLGHSLGLNRMLSTKSSSSAEVILEKVGKAGVITLNRPKALNALNLSMVRQIYPVLKKWQSEVSFVIIKGSGEKAFCAGGDIRAVTDAGKRKDPSATQFFKEEYLLNCLIGSLRVPFIAFIHGITMGGGVGLSVHGKYRVATEKTVFAMPETAIGLFPDVGGSHFLSRLQNQLGIYLGLTGFRLSGADVLRAGIATHFCEYTKLNDLEKELLVLTDAQKIQPILDAYSKKSMEGIKSEFVLNPHLDKIQACFAPDSVEAIVRNLQDDGSDWAKKQCETVMKMSPSSLKITTHLLRKGASMPLAECLMMEYRVVKRILDENDFYEGVRAVLVDRDNSPIWKPAKLEEVTDAKLSSYFAPLPADSELNLLNSKM